MLNSDGRGVEPGVDVSNAYARRGGRGTGTGSKENKNKNFMKEQLYAGLGPSEKFYRQATVNRFFAADNTLCIEVKAMDVKK